jgi:hypothetical protein
MEKKITPTQHFYDNFRLYSPDRRCKECGQTIKSKKPDVKFYLVGIAKNGHLKIRKTGVKTISTYHPSYFTPPTQL